MGGRGEARWRAAAARVCGGEAQLFSRPGNHLSARFPEVTAALATALEGRAAVLDGEIVTVGGAGTTG